MRAATPTPIPFADLDFNLGERWIPAKVYGKFASEFFETDINVSYHSNMNEYSLVCDRKNANIWHKYAVQGEFRRYDGINLLKHALHNTIPDINKSKEVIDKNTGEIKTIKVRDGEKIQQANAKIEEIRKTTKVLAAFLRYFFHCFRKSFTNFCWQDKIVFLSKFLRDS